jgi:hypothetical protein
VTRECTVRTCALPNNVDVRMRVCDDRQRQYGAAYACATTVTALSCESDTAAWHEQALVHDKESTHAEQSALPWLYVVNCPCGLTAPESHRKEEVQAPAKFFGGRRRLQRDERSQEFVSTYGGVCHCNTWRAHAVNLSECSARMTAVACARKPAEHWENIAASRRSS